MDAHSANKLPEHLLKNAIGGFLKQKRLEHSYELQDVSDVINIRAVQLKAIEEGDLSNLPGMVYAIGFVRSYAEFLNLDSQDIVKKFKNEHDEISEKPDLTFPVPVSDAQTPDRRVLISSVIGVIVVLALWGIFSGDDDMAELAEIPELPVELVAENEASNLALSQSLIASIEETTSIETEPKVDSPLLKPAKTTVENKPVEHIEKQVEKQTEKIVKAPPVVKKIAKIKTRIVIKANKPSWIQIQDKNDKNIFKKVMRPGDEYRVPNKRQDLTLITANAGGLDIFVDGKKIAPLGKSGDIMRGVILQASELTRVRPRKRNY